MSPEVNGLLRRAEEMRRLGRYEMSEAFRYMALKVAAREKAAMVS